MSEPPGALAGLTPEEKRALLARLLSERARKPRTVPASAAQRTLWVLEQLAPGRSTYNMHAAVRIEGALDPAVLERAVNEIVRRHESLRTTFTAVDGQPVQVIAPELTVPIEQVDLSVLDETERRGRARRLATEEARRPFALGAGPLLRVKLLRMDAAEFVVLVTLHHINADGWSVQVFMRELVALYDAFSQGRPSPLAELPIQYADYAEWQRRRLAEGSAGEAIAYWKHRLAGIAPLDLPSDRPRPAVQGLRGAIRPFRFPPELGEAIRQLSRRQGCTPFMTLLAALQLLLHRHSGQDDIAVGSPYANRTRPEVEGLIGYFVNLLVLRTDFTGDPPFTELLGRVRQVVLGAIRHQDLPFSDVVEQLNVPRDLSRHPLFQVMFVYQNTPRAEANLGALRLRMSRQPTEGGTGSAKFELTLTMSDTRKGLAGKFQYNTDLFDVPTIDRLIGHFRTILEAIVADPTRPISTLALVGPAERARLTRDWAEPNPGPPAARCVHRAFEEQARATPRIVAVLQDDRGYSYGELNRRANQLARHLRARGVAPETPVGLLVTRRPEMVVALLGILKAGGAYVPIDPAQPAERIGAILADCRAPLVVADDHLVDLLPAPLRPSVVRLDVDWSAIAREDGDDLDGGPELGHLAYLLYTSGTTGRPKGVMIDHAALAHYTEAASLEYTIGSGDRVLQFASLGFDSSVEEIYPCLTRGGTLVLRTDDMLDSHAGFLHACGAWGVTVASLPTAFWHELTAAAVDEGLALPAPLRLVIIGGEPALAARVADWRRIAGHSVRLLNTYGPTEATVVATACDLTDRADDGLVPIGRPLRNVRAYVIDVCGEPAPAGVRGELVLGGPGLARGYWNRPVATASAFAPDPFAGTPGARLYRTGDLARWRADGQLEFLGRADLQVKIRGHRVEPAEVEAVLLGHPAVREAAVTALEVAPGERRLVAYVAGAAGDTALAPSELRAYLRKHLAEAMVPSAFVMLSALPRTPGGKVDRARLPAPGPGDDELEATAPRNEVEATLAAICAELLGRPRVGVEQSFFDMGGNSLLAIRFAARIRDSLQVTVPLQRFFLAPTIAGLAGVVDELRRGADAPGDEPARFDLEADGSLDPRIRPGDTPAEFPADPARVLLTGATGFLGAFLLRDLLRDTNAEVACLVRCGSLDEGHARLRQALARYGLWDADLAGRIRVVPGDLARPRFGLDEAEFARLAEEVEVIYHNGALVHTLYPYEMLRETNVLGTQEVLRLAALGRPRSVHFVSSLSVLRSITRTSPETPVIRETDPLGPHSAIRGGYGRSKWVAERLVTAARARGIPTTIYRPGRISGDSRTGACNLNDYLFLMLRNVQRTGSVPHLKRYVDLVPVNFVSRAIVHLSRRPEARDRTFHLVNPQPLPFPELIATLQTLGAELRTVSPELWGEELRSSDGRSAASVAAPAAVRPPRRRAESRRGRVAIDASHTWAALAGSGITCPAVDVELVAVYYSYLKRNGLLDED
jgi:amino acid adenylation domain-containing protein/thioester reductase-like protein